MGHCEWMKSSVRWVEAEDSGTLWMKRMKSSDCWDEAEDQNSILLSIMFFNYASYESKKRKKWIFAEHLRKILKK